MIATVTIALVIVVIGLWIRWRKNQQSFFKKIGIPGPEPSIFFGNLREMYEKDPVACKKEWIEKYGKVVGYYFGLEPVLLVADVELMKQVLVKDFNSFSDRPPRLLNLRDQKTPMTTHLLNMTGQRWKEVRSLLTPAFTTGKLKKMAPLMNSALEVLLSKIDQNSKKDKEFDIYNLYQGLTMDVIGRTAFGIEAHVQDNPDHALMRTAKAIFSGRFKSLFLIFAFSFTEFRRFFLFIGNLRSRQKNQGVDPIIELIQTCESLIQMRKSDPSLRRPDILQTLIDSRAADDAKSIKASNLVASLENEVAAEDGAETSDNASTKNPSLRKLSDKDITGNTFVFFLAGYETTSTALAFITHILVNKQDIQDKLRTELKDRIGNVEEVNYDTVQQLPYMDRFILECLRMYPPVYSFENRYSNKEVQLGEWKIPESTNIQIPVCFIHHNDEFWPEADKFDPDRFLPENRSKDHSMIWQPFGAGPRNCIGMRFALLEIKLALGRILTKYRLVPSPSTEKEKELKVKVSAVFISPENGIFLKALPVQA